jgi:glutamyl-Q tRNA(Asp) synthetase
VAFVTRFAPSPTGPLHLGHAYSAMLAHDMARAAGGRFLLRIEDIDRSRCRSEWEKAIHDDLTWLGLTWETPVVRQSDRMPAYRATLQILWDRGLLYPCTCSRHDIKMALSAPQEGVQTHGPDGLIYPGTCRWRLKGTNLRSGDTLRLKPEATLVTTF